MEHILVFPGPDREIGRVDRRVERLQVNRLAVGSGFAPFTGFIVESIRLGQQVFAPHLDRRAAGLP